MADGDAGHTFDAAAAHREVELKLALGSDALTRLNQVPPWSLLQRAPIQDIDSVYYDTPTGALRDHGFTLRVRSTPGGIMQTLKTTGPAAGLFDRGEWECALANDTPDLAALGDAPLPDDLRALCNGSLTRICRTRVQRAKKDIAIPGSGHVEVVLDIGAVEIGNDTVPIAEIEMELKNGSPAALFGLARQLNEIAPVHLQTLSKPELGFAAQDVDAPAWRKAAPLALRPEMTVDDALSAIFAGCIAHLLHNRTCACQRLHIEGVHQVRVALRRLRSALRLFADFLPGDARAKLDAELAWLADALGPARDWDVFRAELLAAATPAIADDDAAAALDARVAALQDRAYAHVAETLDSKRYTALMLELSRWQAMRAWRDQALTAASARLFDRLGKTAGKLLKHLHRRVLKRGRDFETLDLPGRHRVRIAVKRLRYGLEFLAELYDGRARQRYQQRLARLQDDLGHLNDVAVAERLVATAIADANDPAVIVAGGALLGWHRRGLADGEPQLLADWQKFESAEPFWR